MTSNIKIALVDDHPAIRLGVKTIINNESDLIIIGEAGDGIELFDLLKKEIPDLIILDIALGEENGIELMRNLLQIFPLIRIIAYSMFDEIIYAEKILEAGGHGYIMKTEILEKMIEAIRIVFKGGIYVSENIKDRLLIKKYSQKTGLIKNVEDMLSQREYEILKYVGTGYSPSEISSLLNLSVSSVNTYKKRIQDKLNINDSCELKKYAIKYFKSL